MNEKATDDCSAIKGLWPIFLIAGILLLVAGVCFYLTVKIWIVITLLGLSFAFLCYGIVFRFCPPEPLVVKVSPSKVRPKPVHKSITASEIPLIVGGMLFMALISPWLLVFALSFKVRMRVQWRREFPKSSKTEIHDFLNGLVRSLGFESATPPFICPHDKLISVYESIYVFGTPDDVESEKIVQYLRERYGIDFKTLRWEDLTIGELYAQAKGIAH